MLIQGRLERTETNQIHLKSGSRLTVTYKVEKNWLELWQTDILNRTKSWLKQNLGRIFTYNKSVK